MKQIYTLVLCLACAIVPFTGKSQSGCNVPLVGKDRVVDQLSGGLLCVLCGSTDLDNIVDGDLNNYASFNTAVVLTATPIISIKDVNKDFASGTRAGFVIQPIGGLLSTGLLAGFQIRTYLNNVLQQTATTSSNGLSLNLLGASGGKQRISFVTSLPYDEIELVQTTTVLTDITSVRVFYAFTEPATGCDYDCITPVVTGNYTATVAPSPYTGITGICVLCDISNTANVVDANTANAGNIYLTLGLGVSGSIGVDVGATIPAGYDVGFAIAKNGSGLIDLDILKSTYIETYTGSTLRESIPFTSLADITVTGGNVQFISFKSSLSFNRFRVRINSLASLLVNVNVLYGFVRKDDDNDGFPNCVDRCASQPDYLDEDGDGVPNACDNDCTLNAGLNISACPPGTTAQLSAAGTGNSWSTVAGNPAAATINASSGLISNMTAEGIYRFQLVATNGCRDTVQVTRQQSALSYACNNPITGFGIIPFDPTNNCLLCADLSLLLDGGLNTYVNLNTSLPIASGTTIAGVRDTLHTYTPNRRVGFVVEAVGGLLDLSVLSNLELRTYLNGTLQQTATTGNALLGAGVLPGNGNRQRLSFIATQPFDAVVLVSNALLSTITNFRIYYAFEEPTTCPDLAQENCVDRLLVGKEYWADIVEDHTGLDGIACAACSVTAIGNVIDNSESSAATINLTIGVNAQASIAVKTIQTLGSTYQVGFIISGGANLLNASVLGGLRLRTYLNNVLVNDYYANNGLVNATVLGNGTTGLVSFRPTGNFDEIRLTIYGTVNALQTTSVYSAFARLDTDGDSTPDCIDKCCSGSDDVDLDGDGAPNSCDTSNDPPLAVNDVRTTPEDTPISISVLANDGDPNFDVISLSSATTPAHGTVLIVGNTVTYTPAANYNGPDMFQYVVCDSYSACSTATVTINVTPVNDAPVANADNATTPEDTPVTFNITSNDTDIDGTINNATIDLNTGVNGVQNSRTVAGQGTFTVDASGNVTFTPVANFNGTSSITYQVCDTGTPLPAACATATITVTVSAVNDAPTVVNDAVTTAEDTPVSLNITANDSDVDGSLDLATLDLDPNTAGVQSSFTTANGTYNHTGSGNVTFTPVLNFHGTSTAQYQVCDNGTPLPAACGTATITVTVTSVNDAPVANNDNATTNEDTPVTFNITANDTDVDGTINNASIDLIPGGTIQTTRTVAGQGTYTVDGSGNVTFTPVANFNGTSSITYEVCDNGNPNPPICVTATITVTVNAVNDAPTVVNDAVTTAEDTPVSLNITANDSDVDGTLDLATLDLDPNTAGVQSSFTTANGTYNHTGSGNVTFTPVLNFHGTSTAQYQVCDNGTPLPAACGTATITVTVTSVNDAPVANNDNATTNEDTPVTFNITANDTDVDGTINNASIDLIPGGTIQTTRTVAGQGTYTVDGSGNVTFTPVANFNGTSSITYEVCDNGNPNPPICVTATITVTVNAVNDAPTVVNDAVTTAEDTPVSLTVTTNDSDVDGTLDLTSVDLDPNTAGIQTSFTTPGGTYTYTGSGNVNFTPASNFNGISTAQYQVCDNGTPLPAACGTATITVTVTAVNDAPVVNNDNVSTNEDVPVTFNVTANDTDVDGTIDNTTLDLNPSAGGVQTSFTVAGQGTFTRDALGNVTFTPVANFNGTSSMTYRVCDTGTPLPAQCNTATITVTVNSVNDAPLAANDQGVTSSGMPVTVNVLVNDTDPDGSLNPASVQVISGPAHGTTSVNSTTGAITYTSTAGFSGYDTLTYVVCDNGTPTACDTGMVSFIVNGLVSDCNDPITGKTAVVDRTGTGLLCVLCGNADIEHLVDGDLSNYAEFSAPATVLTATSVVSIKDIVTDYPAGIRAGYVIEPLGGLLNSSLLGSFQIRTYLNNTLQQTISGANLNVQSINTLRRLSFVSTLPFDELELVLVSTLGALTSVRVYYSFVEPALGCDYECVSPVVPAVYNATINAGHTGLGGLLCLLCDVSNTGNVVNTNTGDFGSIQLVAGVGVNGSISVNTGQTIPGGYGAGFAISDGNGLLGLLGANVLGNTEIITYLAGAQRDIVALNSSTANVILLGGSNAINLVSFKTTQSFDEIRIRVNSILGVGIDVRVHYAFLRPDDDSDGYANCVDKCPASPDYLDADGDGDPDGCDAVCMLNAGIDLSVCPPSEVAQLPAAAMGQTWSALAGNPALASVNASGAVSGMTAEGLYGFVLSQGACADTVYISRFTSTLDPSCNNPITGNKVIIDQVGLTGGICLLCGGGSGQAVIDGNLSNYATYTVGVGVITATAIISVKDTSQVYPAGRRTGFVVEPVGGLLDATVLNSLQIRTYLNNVPRETAIVANGLVAANVIGNGNKQRLSFVTGQSFDEIELVATSVLGVISTLRVYYGFEEDPNTCPLEAGDNCTDAFLATDNTYCGQLSYDRTEVTGVCTGCSLDNLGNLLDSDLTNFSTVNLSVGVGATGRISVLTRQVIPAGYSAGFVISAPVNLLDAAVLGGLTLRTYLNGALRETRVASGGLVNLGVISATTGLTQFSFVTGQSFDEIQIQIDGLVSALSVVHVHYGFARGDADGDGAPDCADKCCGSNDNMDSNGNGIPDGCDGEPIANDDTATTTEDVAVNIMVLANDNFGPDGPSAPPAISVTDQPDHGTATIHDNGTPGNPADDYIRYTPAANYHGTDNFTYQACDSDGDCDTALVTLTITPVNDPPSVPNVTINTPEDTPVTHCVVITDVDNTSGFTFTPHCTPHHGIVSGATIPPLGPAELCYTYTPNPNYYGPDTLCFIVCDASNACDTTYTFINVGPVNDPPIANNDIVSVPEGVLSMISVLSNDMDPDGSLDTASLTIINQPDHGTAVVNPVTGQIEFTPGLNFIGNDTMTYIIADQSIPGLYDTAFVFVTVTPVKVRLALKMQLQGALYASPDTLMRDDLRINGVIPVVEPYTALGLFAHVAGGGGETISNPSQVFANHGVNSIVDWAFVELRDSANPTIVVATRSALLQRDGNVVDTDGVSLLIFGASLPKSYYVAIRHRNHLGCMTASPIPLTAIGTTIDFTNVNTPLWDDGTNLNGLEQVTVNGKFALWAGNVNMNKSVVFAGQSNDKDPIFNQIDQAPGNILRSQSYVFNGYRIGDVTMNAKAVFAGQNNDVDPIFNNVDGHPRNIFKSQSFVIREQLPNQ